METNSKLKENFMKKFSFGNKILIKILIFGVIIRSFTFFVIFVYDSVYWIEMSSFFKEGINPYETDVEFYYKYPPLFHYFINFFGLVSNYTFIGPKLMIVIFDTFNIILIYKIGSLLKNEILGKNAAFFYTFNPLIILQILHDVNEFVTLFFTLLSVFFLIKEKFILSSISLAFGIAFKLYPLFFLIPITIYIYRNYENQKIQNIIYYYIFIILTFIILSLPFLLLNHELYIDRLFIHTNRMNLGGSMAERIPEIIFLFDPIIEIYGFQFSYQFLIQMSLLFIIFLFLFYSKKQFNIHDLFVGLILISFILPLITYQVQLKYTNLISFPFLVFIIYNNKKNFEENELYFFFLINLLLILFLFLIFSIFSSSIIDLLSYDNLVEKGKYYVSYWMISFSIFIVNEYRHKKESDYKILCMLVVPFITFNLFPDVYGVILTVLVLVLAIVYLISVYWIKNNENSKFFIISDLKSI